MTSLDMVQAAEPPCEHCEGVCCRQAKHHAFAVLLDPEEHAAFPESIWIADQEGWALPYRNGACLHFDLRTSQCLIYDRRPLGCRDFSCCAGYGRRDGYHGSFLENNPRVVRLIEKHIVTTLETKDDTLPAPLPSWVRDT